MPELVQYRVRLPFKYGRKRYKPGDIWEPEGGRYDTSIIRNKLVVIERVKAEPKAKPEPKAKAADV